jgi:nicotinate dehydrogenase subunit A
MAASIAITVNGRSETIARDGATPLLDVLRNDLGLVGSRFGCGEEACGACLVLIDGTPQYACTTTIDNVSGRSVTTIEGLAADPLRRAIVDVFVAEQAGQCGYCLPGIVVRTAALLAADRHPTRDAIVAALDPHLCRCGSHVRIIRAVERAAASLRGDAP